MVTKKIKIPVPLQALHLKKMFPGSIVKTRMGNSLVWEHTLIPTFYSNSYKVRLRYRISESPKVFVLTNLAIYDDEKFLPHVYSTAEQRLCLYYPPAREWNPSMLFADTIVPWISEWLMFYEIWLVTGEWLGGEIGHKNEAEKRHIESSDTENKVTISGGK